MQIEIKGTLSASDLVTSPEEVKEIIEKALTSGIPCQLYGMNISVEEVKAKKEG